MLSLLLAAAVLAAPTPAAALPRPQQVDLGGEIRTSIRWLRSAQDLESGAYEGSLEATALAVIAFAECPDHYRAIDGPFVRKALEHLVSLQREDGAIGPPDAAPADLARTTALAAAALRLGDGGHAEARARARAWLNEHAAALPEDFPYGLELGELPEGASGAGRIAAALIAERDAGGFWVGPRGRVVETAARVIALSHLAAIEAAGASSAGARHAGVRALPDFSPADRAAALEALVRGATFLAQLADEQGRFGAPGQPDAGLTAMALGGAAGPAPAAPEAAIQARIDAGLAWLVSLQHEDGSIHDGKLANYITSAAILALARAGRDEHAAGDRAGARPSCAGLQTDDERGLQRGRPVLRRHRLRQRRSAPTSPTCRWRSRRCTPPGASRTTPRPTPRRLRFLQRTPEPLRVERRAHRAATASADRAAATTAARATRPGDSKAGFVELADGTRVPRSYGSMTYALLKCYVFAGLPKDDPRLQAAFEWCQRNYTLDVNPGFDVALDPTAPPTRACSTTSSRWPRPSTPTASRPLSTPTAASTPGAASCAAAWSRCRAEPTARGSTTTARAGTRAIPLLATAYALLALETALPPAEGGR